jgi:hypothetical protein
MRKSEWVVLVTLLAASFLAIRAFFPQAGDQPGKGALKVKTTEERAPGRPAPTLEDRQTQPVEPGKSQAKEPIIAITGNFGTKDAPLYVKAECERGCGYGDDGNGWWRRFWTDPSATFAAFLALFTAALYWTGRKQWIAAANANKAAARAAEATERNLATLERPWVFVSAPQSVANPDGDDFPPCCLFDISNHGRMPAIVDECLAVAGYGAARPPEPAAREEFYGPLGPGERIKDCIVAWDAGGQHEVVINTETGETHPCPERRDGDKFFFFAQVRYSGVNGQSYASSFCWRWDYAARLWVKTGGDDVNYVR